MSQESELVLRKSLDAIDGLRRRFVWAFAGVVVLSCIGAVRLFYVSRSGEGLERLIQGSTIVLSLCIAGWAIVVCLHTTRMTRRILRAIELLSKT